MIVLSISSGCSLQSPYISPLPDVPVSEIAADKPSGAAWWLSLHDPAIDALMTTTLAENPELGQAIARMDEAKAQVSVNSADKLPVIAVATSLSTANTTSSAGSEGGTGEQIVGRSTTTTTEPSLSWELDLFGRVRGSVEVAARKLDARTADADFTRLSLSTQLAGTVLDLRACRTASQIIGENLTSYEKTLGLIRKKLQVGFSAPVDEASALRDLAAERTAQATQQETCAQYVNSLVALSGRNKGEVLAAMAQPMPNAMPEPPPSSPRIPAIILASHPSVIAADRDAAAAWADIGVARAERFPKIDLLAALTGQWIQAAGTAVNLTTWALGPSLNATLFDNGKGAANVDAAEARYREAAAQLQQVLRSVTQDIENALAAQKSADDRVISARESVAAAKTSFTATEAQWKQGVASLLELENTRRQYANAQSDAVNAERDRAKAWVLLVRATGNAITATKDTK